MIGRAARIVTLMCAILFLLSVSGVYAVWRYFESPQDADQDLSISMNKFVYDDHEMPEDEVSLLTRICDLLNNEYTNDIIEASGETPMEYLLNTLDSDWDADGVAAGSFVGSMDPYDGIGKGGRLDVMFGDIIKPDDPNHASFILKKENLIGDPDDGHFELSLYSTSDYLHDYYGDWHNAVVGVYLSVFTKTIDADGNERYELFCDSIHGYCMETSYTDGSWIGSFSTNHWRDELFYWHWTTLEYPYLSELRAITGEDRYDYNCYHSMDGNYVYDPDLGWLGAGWIVVPTIPNSTSPEYGKTAQQRMQEILASRGE